MKREILFRGKRVDNVEWAEGSYYYAKISNQYFIVKEKWAGNAEFIRVIPESVGQYTGITDKNGNKIFEGDIVRICENICGKIKSWEHIVCFKNGCFSLYDPNCCEVCRIGFGITCNLDEAFYMGEGGEVIGNIFDNPELIKP